MENSVKVSALFPTGDIAADGKVMKKKLREKFMKYKKKLKAVLDAENVTIDLNAGNVIVICGRSHVAICTALHQFPELALLESNWENEPVNNAMKALEQMAEKPELTLYTVPQPKRTRPRWAPDEDGNR